MADPFDSIGATARRVGPAWTPEREAAVRDRIERAIDQGRRTRGRMALATGALLVVVCGIALGRLLAPSSPPAAAVNVALARAELLALEDGSKVEDISGDARVTPVEVGPSAASIRLDAGKARFDVARDERRLFRVLARDVEVSVLGTVFDVALETDAVTVGVERGRVAVLCRGERRELGTGETLRCASTSASAPRGSATAPGAEHGAQENALPALPAPDGASAARANVPPLVSWRSLAQEGDYRAAFARMTADGAGAVRDEPGDLLFAADVARLSGHPEAAIVRLERVVEAHTGDSRASLAAFTLGRTLLDALGRPREAASAFAAARRLDPSGAMAQDALAREVESWSRAGEVRLARERAEEYVERHPNGRRTKAVRHHGALD